MTSRDTQRNAKPRQRARYITKLADVPNIPAHERKRLEEVAERFSFRANDYYLSLIDWDDPDDPIRRLVIPNANELTNFGAWDASNEEAITVTRGVQHKYGSTVLLLVNEVCDAYCRYCFRKRLFTNENDEATNDITAGLDYIRTHPEVDNVLLTGGDPLLMSTRRIGEILAALREIEHVRIIRIGSKTPAFNPGRITGDPELLDVIRKHSHPDRRVYIINHFDHPNELTDLSREALRLFLEAGAICVNQTPLIRGISDDPAVLTRLWNELSYMGVPQYYVFQCRPTAGNETFEIPITEAYFKIEEAKKTCSGLSKRLKYVMSHESGKVEILGVDHSYIYLRYHRAKDPVDEQRMIVCHRDDSAYWLDNLKPIAGYRNDFYRSDSAEKTETKGRKIRIMLQ